MNSPFLSLLRRDLLLAFRNPGDLATPVIFFVVAVTIFSFAAGGDLEKLSTIGPGVVWAAALLSAMLSLDGIFRDDYEDGTLEQLLLAPSALSALVLAKTLAHWLSTGLPLIAVSPVLGILMNLDSYSNSILAVTVALSTPVFSLVGAFGAALVVSQRKSGVLLSLLTLPLCIPVLIFSVLAVAAAASQQPVGGHLSLLGAFLVFSLTVAPFATAGSLRLMAGD
ncbi:MAG: heme exporter protein CcmB [Acidiferrobacterales bacterium]|nr:heme exporter protein CcmB [Acidiferrobacterales bacterium]